MPVEYTTPTTLTEEDVEATDTYDECPWKSELWEGDDADTSYTDDIDEISPDDNISFP